jgi:hypothetical protein
MNQSVGGGIDVIREVGSAYFRRRYTILFYSLILTLIASPMIGALGLRGDLIDWLLAANLAMAVAPVNAGRSRNLLVAVVIVLWLARPITSWFGHPLLSQITLGCWTLIGLIAAAVALRFALRGDRVDTEHLFAALSAYLLAGIYFGLLYWVIEQIHAGSFNAALSRSGSLYYSFVVLATLGFGAIVPVTDVTRGITVVEAVGGQLFLAVLVARLISSYSHSPKD